MRKIILATFSATYALLFGHLAIGAAINVGLHGPMVIWAACIGGAVGFRIGIAVEILISARDGWIEAAKVLKDHQVRR